MLFRLLLAKILLAWLFENPLPLMFYPLAYLQQIFCGIVLVRILLAWMFLLNNCPSTSLPSYLAMNLHWSLYLELSLVSPSSCRTPLALVPLENLLAS